MKIYLVTSGEYSDYGIDKIFLNKKIAEDYAKSRNKMRGDHHYDEYGVEEWETSDEEPFKKDYELKRYWTASSSIIDGYKSIDTDEVYTDDSDYKNHFSYSYTEEDILKNIQDGMKKFGNKVAFEKYHWLFSSVSDKSLEHAEKMLYDEIAKVKAIFEGIAA